MQKALGVGFVLIGLAGASAAGAQDQAAQIAAGKGVFMEHCAACHGEDLTPVNPAVFNLKELRASERNRFNRSVIGGVGAEMPAWRGIVSDAQLDQLWAFIMAAR